MKCAIIATKKPNRFTKDEYQCFIGVEGGSVYLAKLELSNKVIHVSDFDSISENDLEMLQSNKNSELIKFDHDEKKWTDGEEAIKYVLENIDENAEIDFFGDEDGRIDHMIMMVNILRKFDFKFIGNNVIIEKLKPNNNFVNISKKGDKVTFFSYEEIEIITKGLRWDVNEKLTLDESTKMISNEVINESFMIKVDKEILVIHSLTK